MSSSEGGNVSGTGSGENQASGGGDRRDGGRRRDEREGRSGRRRGGRRRGGQGRRGGQRPAAERPARKSAPPASLVAYLARAGVGSRRLCDEMVRAGRVTVNDAVVDFPREKLRPEDVVAVDGEVVEWRPLRYLLVNKARGIASTRSDPHADKVIVDVVPDGRVLFPVGRLDVQTTGLIVLTNDGPLAHRLMHPRYGVPKTYVARVRGRVGRRQLATLRSGLELEDGPTAPADARLLKQSARTALVEVTIHQGRKRQVRRMFAALDLTVDDLHRRRYGPLTDADLAVGDWRELSDDEVEALRRAAEHVDDCVGQEPVEHGVDLAAPAEDDGRKAPEDAATLDGASDASSAAAGTSSAEPPSDGRPPDESAGAVPPDQSLDDAPADGSADESPADESADEGEAQDGLPEGPAEDGGEEASPGDDRADDDRPQDDAREETPGPQDPTDG